VLNKEIRTQFFHRRLDKGLREPDGAGVRGPNRKEEICDSLLGIVQQPAAQPGHALEAPFLDLKKGTAFNSEYARLSQVVTPRLGYAVAGLKTSNSWEVMSSHPFSRICREEPITLLSCS